MQIKFVDSKQEESNSGSEFEKFIGNNEIPFNII